MKINLTNKLFKDAIPVLDILERHGHQAYFVGGCVRDTIMNRSIHDIDIASSATPDEIQALFHKTIDIGIEHGTVIVLFNGEPYEITTFRSEGDYTDHRRPDQVNFVRSLKEDTLRRDFTMNAIAINQYGQVFDYHGGQEDIAIGQIRAVGNPIERFTEDALRMIRAVRFACQLGFKIENNTFDAMVQLSPTIAFLSVERLKEEWTKILLGPYFYQHLSTIIESNMTYQFPEFDQFDIEDVLNQYLEFKQNISSFTLDSPIMAWSFFMHYTGLSQSEIKHVLKRWTFSNKSIDAILQINQHFSYLEFDEQIDVMDVYQLSIDIINEMYEIHQVLFPGSQNDISAIKASLPITSKNDIQVNGQDIIRILNLKKGGPIIGEIIANLEYHIIHGNLDNEYSSLKDYILSIRWGK